MKLEGVGSDVVVSMAPIYPNRRDGPEQSWRRARPMRGRARRHPLARRRLSASLRRPHMIKCNIYSYPAVVAGAKCQRTWCEVRARRQQSEQLIGDVYLLYKKQQYNIIIL